MALFDYNRKAMPKQPEAEAEKGKDKDREALQEAEPVPVEQERVGQAVEPAGSIVLQQYPADRVRASARAGYLRADFPDPDSETGKGFMLLKPEHVKPSLSSDGSPVAGRVDLTVSVDGNRVNPYYVTRDGDPTRSEKPASAFKDEWDSQRRAAAESARASVGMESGRNESDQERSMGYG